MDSVGKRGKPLIRRQQSRIRQCYTNLGIAVSWTSGAKCESKLESLFAVQLKQISWKNLDLDGVQTRPGGQGVNTHQHPEHDHESLKIANELHMLITLVLYN